MIKVKLLWYVASFDVNMMDLILCALCLLSDDEPLEAPTNLVTSEVKQSSFRTTWTPPNGTMDQFRVTYSVAAGGPPKEVRWSSPPHVIL